MNPKDHPAVLCSWHNGAVVLRRPPDARSFEDYEFLFEESGTVWPWFALERELVIRASVGAKQWLSTEASPYRADGREAEIARWVQSTEQLICRRQFRRYSSRSSAWRLGELFTLRKGSRVAVCDLWSHPIGGEVRVTVDGELLRSEAKRDGLALPFLAITLTSPPRRNS